LLWIISKQFHHNGLITARGQDALNDDGGGGSGGSVLLDVMNITGHGEINVNGGSGKTGGGGGSGGRIGLHVNFQNNYGGIIILVKLIIKSLHQRNKMFIYFF